MTTDDDWDPSVLYHAIDDDDQWFDAVSDILDNPTTRLLDEFGDYRATTIVNSLTFDKKSLEDEIITTDTILYQVQAQEIKSREPDYEALRPYFGWLPLDVVKKTYKCTTQFARMPMSTVLKKHYKSPFPANNVHRCNKPIATDAVHLNTPAVDCGHMCAQLFVGTTSLVTDVYSMKTDSQFVNTLEDIIWRR